MGSRPLALLSYGNISVSGSINVNGSDSWVVNGGVGGPCPQPGQRIKLIQWPDLGGFSADP